MVSRSRYDELHNKYHKILTTKSGTRYERLAALVFKALEEQNAIIHDLKLAGDDPEVKHQIDVTIEIEGVPKRKIIECKDFDVSGEKVGLGIVRNFRSVVEDTKADEGIILSCNGFTEDAKKYALSKSIKLAVLRLFETRDIDGRITKIIVGIIFQRPTNPKVSL
jgi:Restriction endonuclease